MGHKAQDGKKVDEMSLFKKKYEAGTDRWKQKLTCFKVLLSKLSLEIYPQKNFDQKSTQKCSKMTPKKGYKTDNLYT